MEGITWTYVITCQKSEIRIQNYPGYSGDIGELDQFLCAMANTSGGTIVLGVGENKNGKTLIGFKKEPFRKEDGDQLMNKISQFRHNLELIPNVKTKLLEETDMVFPEGSFYVILQVEPVIKDRPYMLKGSQCYIRVGSTNQPARRSIVIDLCKQTIDRTTAVTNLKAIASMLKRQLEHIREQTTQMSPVSQESPFFLPEIDLTLYKQGAANCMWFLADYSLITERLILAQDHKHDFYSSINFIEELNSAMNRFNIEQMNAGNRNEMFLRWYKTWESSHMQWIIDYLNRVMESASEFLS